MSSIRLQFATENNIASWTLHWFDHTWCSHVDAVMPEGGLLGAKYCGGVCIRPNEGFTKTLMVELPTTQEICEDFYQFCRSQLGKPYDVLAITAFAFGREWRDNSDWFCSELIAAA